MKLPNQDSALLAGKVLRLNMAMPEIRLDILFTHERLRFEPVTTDSVFEQSGAMNEHQQATMERARIGHSRPDCTITVDNPAQLLNLMRGTEGNLPIAGDYKVLMQLKQLVAGFDPDVAGQLEPFIGKPMASQLHLLISQLKGSWVLVPNALLTTSATGLMRWLGNSVPDLTEAAEVNELKQQLLKLRADVEREEAKLAAIKDEQARFLNNSFHQ